MDDFLHAGKVPLDGRIVKAMRIGDHPDSKGPAFAYRATAAAADL
jgi:hypothetical protein